MTMRDPSRTLYFLLGLFLFLFTAFATYVLLAFVSVDTSDWFMPESNAPVLEVHHNGTGQTVNKQLTIDAAELQGSIDSNEFDYRQSIDNVGELSTTAELQGRELQ